MTSPVRIVHISDAHITTRPQFIPRDYNTIIETMKHIPHDFCIFTGDLTQDGLRQDYDLANDLRTQIPSEKIYWIIGNHDSKNGGSDVWEETVGPREFFEVTDDILLVGLDSCVPDRDEGRFGREALDYAKKILSKYSEDRIKIVAFHHHLLPIAKTGRERSNAVDAGDMLSLLLDYGVDAVFTGHKHHPNVSKVEDTIIISAGTMSSYKTRSGGPRTFNYIEITPKEDVKVQIRDIKGNTLLQEVKTITRRFRMVNSAGGVWLRIAQISGTDIGTVWKPNETLLEKGLELVKFTNPNLIVHCGNLTSKGRTTDYEKAVKIIKELNSDYVLCPGPNDLKGYGETLLNKYFDFDRIIEKENSDFYILNTSSPETEKGVVGRTTLNRLMRHVFSERAKEAGKFHTAIMHHHIIPIPLTRETSALEDAGDVLKAITEAGVNLVLSGHLGRTFCTRVEKTIFVNCNTLSSQFTASLENSFNLIDISTDGAIVVSEIHVPSGFRNITGIFPGIQTV